MVVPKLCQTIPWGQATVLLDNEIILLSTFSRIDWLYSRKRTVAASAVFGNYESTPLAVPILVMRRAESIQQNIWESKTKCTPIAAFWGYPFMV